MRQTAAAGRIVGAVAVIVAVLGLSSAADARTVARCDEARLERSLGVAQVLARCGRIPAGGTAESSARHALRPLAPALGLRRDGRDLALLRAEFHPFGRVVRFRQVVGGVPVRFAQVVVVVGPDGSVEWVASGARPDAAPASTEPVVTARQALAIARARVPRGAQATRPRAELVIAPRPRGDAVLAWDVVIATRAPAHEWRVLVSAADGTVLDVADELRRVDGSGAVYVPNPVQGTNQLTLVDGDDAASPALDAARVAVTLTDLDAGTALLRGAFADPAASAISDCPLPYTPGTASEAGRAYAYSRADDRFEEANAYAAVTLAARTYHRLGFTAVMNHPLPMDVHCMADDNSFYSGADQALRFGDGGVDDAEDGDIVLHEYGHATQDDQVPGFGPGSVTEQRAIGEGFGDLLAALVYLDRGDPAYQGSADSGRRFCVAEWDAVSYNPFSAANTGSGCLRWVDGRSEDTGAPIGNYGGTPSGVHADGRYWSAALTCVLRGMETAGVPTGQARDDVLRLVLAHHAMLVPTTANTAFDDSVAALLSADRMLFAHAHVKLIESCAEARLAVPIELDATPPDIDVSLTPAQPDGQAGWYRGRVGVDWTVNEAPPFQSNGCDDTSVDQDTPGLTLVCTATSDGGMTSESVTIARDSSAPLLAPSLTPPSPVVGQAASASPNASDGLSGIAQASCDAPDTSTAGSRRLTCRATDIAGNPATATLDYTVSAGALPPIDGPPSLAFGKTRLLRDGRLRITVTADRQARVTASGSLTKRLRLRSPAKLLRARRPTTLTLTGPRAARAWLLRKRARRRVTLRVVFKISGVATPIRRSVRVPRAR
jgi:hypothetical protein